MYEATIKLDVPGLPDALLALTQAVTCLADAVGSLSGAAPVSGGAQVSTPLTDAAAPANPVPLAAAAAPTVSVQPATAPAVPVAAPAVPVADAPAYTLAQISKAGAALVDAGKMEQLLALLARYGVQAVTQIPPEQYGPFATELRALGAQI